ncbi:hypothetical protein PSQ90_04270 [Devosia rhodophyticola]|uniref:ParB/Sulfiredoxin domain-containing protein n=1 Tax=Devosia rhodophyticola TaxID=3026423 RepID=A0ABY7Z0M0_9HYPH|nr:hypothetical protein [Devosia rhodophyticola]WDR06684.1 hypothetical protein PSQ90_04270 [Devosia rhodophyticola]
MIIKSVNIVDLVVNRANDRHGELENETAAIAWLFNERETHMRNLTKDIVDKGEIYEMPLVTPEGTKFVVFDGNRRVTCLKLLANPRKAPNTELQEFFTEQGARWKGEFPVAVQCQVEANRERIDEILFRRHTGTQSGVGQSTWDDRMKATFVERTGQSSGISVADEIERRLKEADMLPGAKKIPRSTMNRLLSAEPFRNRLGFSVTKGRFEFTHDENVALVAMARVANDLANKKLVLGDIWDVDGKRKYLDSLEHDGVLPNATHTLSGRPVSASPLVAKPAAVARQAKRNTLIPQTEYGLVWPGRLQRHHHIWEELQFRLQLTEHPNAISVLFRVLLELSIENYIVQAGVPVNDGDKLAARLIKVGKHLQTAGKIDSKQLGVLTKFQQSDQLVSADTLNRYVHSPNFAPSPEHLASMWDSLANVICLCLQA